MTHLQFIRTPYLHLHVRRMEVLQHGLVHLIERRCLFFNSELIASKPLMMVKCHAKVGFDHGVGHPLLLLYDAKAPLGKNSNYFNGLGHDLSNPFVSLF
jgi:hypothetical protein